MLPINTIFTTGGGIKFVTRWIAMPIIYMHEFSGWESVQLSEDLPV